MVYNPWRRLRRLHDWTLAFGPLPDGVLGHTDWTTKTITLAVGQYQRERRCTIDHEIEHAISGPVDLTDPRAVAREEQRINRLSARRLVPNLRAMADALIAAEWCLDTAAEELHVDADTLAVRLGGISHPAEQGYLRRRFNDYLLHEHPEEGSAC